MSRGIVRDFEYIGAHIKDYIKGNNLFNSFGIEDIKTIMKYAKFTADDFNTLLEQSFSHVEANTLYNCTRNANVSINNMQEALSTLKSIKKCMTMGILEGIIDILQKDIPDSANNIENPQKDLNQIQTEKENIDRDMQSVKSSFNDKEANDLQKDFLSKISELKISEDFEEIYNFLDEISAKGNQQMMSKVCEERLWELEDEYNKNALHEASKKGNLRLVKSLIECGCDKETKNKYKNTPLIYASSEGHLEVVKYLISVGANKEAKSKNGFTPLIYSSQNGHLEVVKYLISIGVNIEAKTNNGWTPIICASCNGHLEVVKYLISVGANKEAKNYDGCTPLIWASRNGHLEIVKYLISVGANKEEEDFTRFTPLIWASKWGKLEVVKYLISVGANKEAMSIKGQTALSVATDEVRQYLESVCHS